MNFFCKKIIVWVAGAWVIITGLSPAAEGRHQALQSYLRDITLSGDKIVNGGTLLLEIDTRNFTTPVTDLRIRFQEATFPAYEHPFKPQGFYFGLVGIPLRSEPGQTILTLEWAEADGRHTQTVPFCIVAASYRIDKLTVDSRKVNLNKKDLTRVTREKQEIKRIYANGSGARLWHGRFRLPVKSDVTSPFGNKRMFNGQLKSFHNGVDFRAQVGKPVYASNKGIVRLAKNLFFSGNIVMIDHGTGVFTNYAHLSKIDVIPDQHIEKGQQIGLSGATGRVNGPHLHWGIKVTDTYVDPLQFVDVIALLSGD